jgi:hypothetical protein
MKREKRKIIDMAISRLGVARIRSTHAGREGVVFETAGMQR